MAVGTVTDTAMSSSTTTRRMTSYDNARKLEFRRVLFRTGASLATGAGDLTLNVTGAVTQTATGIITGTGLQVLGSGTVNLDQAANKIGRASCRERVTIREVDVN